MSKTPRTEYITEQQIAKLADAVKRLAIDNACMKGSLNDIRNALGDTEGTLTHYELVERVRRNQPKESQ